MIESFSQLMSGVLIASTAFLGLTLVHLGQLNSSVAGKKELKRSRKSLLWSFIIGILTVLFTILWFTSHWPWGVLLSTITLMFQINLLWPEVWRFWTSTR